MSQCMFFIKDKFFPHMEHNYTSHRGFGSVSEGSWLRLVGRALHRQKILSAGRLSRNLMCMNI